MDLVQPRYQMSNVGKVTGRIFGSYRESVKMLARS